MKTKNQIKKILNDFADSHGQINSFGYGQEFEQQAMENNLYPLMWVLPLPSTLNTVDLNRRYAIGLYDRVRKDESNELEVESDTELILLDLLAHLRYLSDKEQEFRLDDSSISFTPTWEKWTDEVTGHIIEVNIVSFFDYNKCAIPIK